MNTPGNSAILNTPHHSDIAHTLVEDIMATGAVAVGISKAEELPLEVRRQYDEWIERGDHAGMDYLPRHAMLRSHPRFVLEEVASVVSIAYSYAPSEWRSPSLPAIACYAYGDDYHDVLRRRLQPVVERMEERFGGKWRICIDSAPVAERYWAAKSGIARIGLNGCAFVEGHGSFIFLVEILTSHELPPASSQISHSSITTDSDKIPHSSIDHITCKRCGACFKSCPTGALRSDGTIDSRRCLNYLTIEHRGEWTSEGLEVMQTEAGRHALYGCDICRRVCPHNRDIPPTKIAEFYPRVGIINPDSESFYTFEGINKLTPAEFSRLFKGSPIKRVKYAGLMRNAGNLKP